MSKEDCAVLADRLNQLNGSTDANSAVAAAPEVAAAVADADGAIGAQPEKAEATADV